MGRLKIRLFKWIFICLAVFLLQGVAFPSPGFARDAQSLKQRMEQARKAGVSPELLNRLLAAGYTRNLDAAAMSRFLILLSQAATEGMPIAGLVDKVEEGLAKNIAPEIIERVLRRLLESYRLLGTMSAPSGRDEVLPSDLMIRLGQVLLTGLNEGELHRLINNAPAAGWAELTTAAEALAALKQYRLDQTVADRVTTAGLRHGYFKNNGLDLLRLVGQAKLNQLPDRLIGRAALDLVSGNKNLSQASQSLGLASADNASGYGASRENRGGQSSSGGNQGSGSGRSGSGGSGSGGSDGGAGGGGGGGNGGGGGGRR